MKNTGEETNENEEKGQHIKTTIGTKETKNKKEAETQREQTSKMNKNQKRIMFSWTNHRLDC